MNIRGATARDEERLVQLWHDCGLTRPHNDPVADFRRAVGKAGSDVLVADDGGIAGSILVGHDGHRGWLYYVAVAPGRRNQGGGRALVRAAEAWLAERGIPKVQLMIRETNEVAAAFYRRLGYDPMPRINMEKWLKP
jgi:ribosomal protein S18 acetylase RimI-like enzyme